jgi:hypothetical protein
MLIQWRQRVIKHLRLHSAILGRHHLKSEAVEEWDCNALKDIRIGFVQQIVRLTKST